ncbi:COG4315 family predicted lipoprotein [Streptomyces sp. UG1]|uniref:COG4315 family predicted lipoprotein n=1 Tax=Streptomyces sp. UG1 TaxID=3417652 RepID=UPI003CEDE439
MHHIAKPWVTAVAVALLAVVCNGCGDDDGGPEATLPPAVPTTTTAPGTGTPTGPATVSLRSSGLGRILVDDKGRTLYLFEADTSSESTCNDACARAWPPLTTSGEPKAEEGVKGDLLATTTRDDGDIQVTYNGHPLYYYQDDEKPGDTTGQGLDDFGAEWYVLNADGNKVEGEGEDRDGGY